MHLTFLPAWVGVAGLRQARRRWGIFPAYVALPERMLLRYGAGAIVAMTGMLLAGWGLVFLGAAALFEVFAIAATPSALQEVVQRSYFGNEKGRYAKSQKEALVEQAVALVSPLKGVGKRTLALFAALY